MPNLPGTAALAALGAARSGATFVKVGLWGVSTEADAVALLRAVRDGVAGVPGAVVVAGGLRGRPARARTRRSRPSCCRASRARRASASACSTRPSRTAAGCWTGSRPTRSTSLVAEAHAAGLQVALAGALRAEDLPVVRDAGADIAGVRSAACRDGRRSGPLDAARVRALSRPAPTPPRGGSMSGRRGAGGRPCARCARAWRRGRRRPRPRPPPRPAASRSSRSSVGAAVSIRQRRPKPTCQRSSRSTRSMPSRTPGRAPSARSSSSACCPASKTTPSSSMW